METILRRTSQIRHREPTKEALGLTLEEEAYRAYYKGELLPLTVSEYLLLQTLYKEPTRVFNREQLILVITSYSIHYTKLYDQIAQFLWRIHQQYYIYQ